MNIEQEKRKYQRAKAFLPVKISTLAGGKEPFSEGCMTGDISEGGISSRLPGFVQMAKRLVLEMSIPGTSSPARAIAKVAWIKKETSGDGYSIGLQFLESSPAGREALKRYVSASARV